MRKSKKESPTKLFERQDPKKEYLFEKHPQGEWYDNAAYSTRHGVFKNLRITKKNARIYGPRIKDIHNHSTSHKYIGTLPGREDYEQLFVQPEIKTKIVSQHNPETGKIEGYYFVRKTKKTPQVKPLPQRAYDLSIQYEKEGSPETYKKLEKLSKEYNKSSGVLPIAEEMRQYKVGSSNYQGTLEFCKAVGLQFKAVPTKGFYFDIDKKRFVKQRKLEYRLLMYISFLTLLVSILISSMNITGFIIGFNISNAEVLASILFMVGITCFYLFTRTRA